MLLSPHPGVNWSPSPPSLENLPAHGNSWSVQRATYTSPTSTQKYLVFKSYVPKDEPASSLNTLISDLVLELSSNSTISDFESLSVTHRLDKSSHFTGHKLLTVQFHLTDGCSLCEAGIH